MLFQNYIYYGSMMALPAQLVKNPPAMQEIPVQFLGQEDPLEEGMATYSSILAQGHSMNRETWHGVTESRPQLSD